MPKPRPKHLHKETTRHGAVVWYVRVNKGPRVRIAEAYGTKTFYAAVDAAVAGKPIAFEPNKPIAGTIAWAAGLYRRSNAWSALSPATRKQRDNILERIVRSPAGAGRFVDLSRKHILDGIKARAETPAAARHFLSTMRGMFAWAIDENMLISDPTAGIVAKVKASDGHPVWTDEDVVAYEARWPVGTRERVAFDILLWTGLRRGDAVMLGRQHVKAGVIRMNTEKTGERVAIVMCQELVATLVAGPCGDLTFIAGEKGQPRVKESFGEWFRRACQAAGVGKSAHGLRKAAATRAADNGATESQLEAIFGWRGGRMAAHYTKAANRERLSIEGAALIAKRKP